MSQRPGRAAVTTTVLRGARKVDADGRVDECWLLFHRGTVVSSGTGAPPPADETVDLGGAWLTPGFVDLHVHGGGGHAFDDGTEAMRRALAAHRAHGTTRSLVSLVSRPLEELEVSLAAVAALDDPLVLGVHLEGPFFAPSRRGAHDPWHLRDPAPDVVDRLLSAGRGVLRSVSLAS